MYKVFIYDRPLVFLPPDKEDAGFEDWEELSLEDFSSVDLLMEFVSGTKLRARFKILDNDEHSGWKKFKEQFQFIPAGGGLIQNRQHQLLFIHRNGKWDMPKGKAEGDETIEQTAVREVVEECGLTTPPRILRKLGDSYHTYPHKSRFVLKQTAWYLMQLDGEQSLSPQMEEGIDVVKWYPSDDLEEPLSNTYPSIAEVLSWR